MSEANGPVDAFLSAYLEDLRAECPRPLAAYQERFPGHEDAIAAAWRQCHDGCDPPARPVVFDSIGAYEVLQEIGRGAQGVVYLARDTRLKREVALKVFPRSTSSPDVAFRMRREAEALSRLDDRGICSVYELGETAREAFIAMRYVRGRTLADEIRDEAREPSGESPVVRLRLSRALRLIEEVARSIHKAHTIGIVHRDLKPGNIMVDPEDHAVVLDFGLARDEDSALPTLTRTGDVLGTPAYMSPEQISGRVRQADARCDVYALGVCLYEYLTLRRPFAAPTRAEIERQIASSEPVDPRRVDRRIPRDVATIVAIAMAKEPRRRYATALDLAEDLRRARAGEPILARRPGIPERIVRWVRRRPLQAALGVTALVALSLGIYLAIRWRDLGAEDERRRATAVEETLEVALDSVASDAKIEASLARLDQVERKAAGWRGDVTVGRVLCLLRLEQFAKARELLDASRGREAEEPALEWARWRLLQRVSPADAPEFRSKLGEPADGLSAMIAAIDASERLGYADPAVIRPEVDRMVRTVLAAPAPRRSFHFLLVILATEAGDTALATATADAMVRLWPTATTSWIAMGYSCQRTDPPRAIRFLRKALDLGANILDQGLGILLANSYAAGGDEETCARVYREALAVEGGLTKQDRHLALFNAGNSEFLLGEWDEAIRHCEEIVRIQTRPSRICAQALCTMGQAMILTTRRGEALDAIRRGHEMGSALEVWNLPSADWVEEARLFLSLATRIDANPTADLPDDEEISPWQWAAAAEIGGRYATAARWFRQVHGPDATLAGHDRLHHRASMFIAATAAFRAAAGEGSDAGMLDPAAKVELRALGFSWLDQDLDAIATALDSKELAPDKALRRLQRWKHGPRLAPLRDAAFVRGMTSAEQDRLQAIWKRWEQLVARLRPEP